MRLALLSLISLLYVFSSLFVWDYLKKIRVKSLKLAQVALGFGLSLHLILFAYEVFFTGPISELSPLVSGLSFTLLVAAVCFFLVVRKTALPIAMTAVIPITVMLMGFQLQADLYRGISLPSNWLWAHVGLMILGEFLFFFSAVVAGVYLWIEKKLRQKNSRHWMISAISLPTLDELLGALLLAGFLCLTFGFGLGSFFAGKFWQAGWWWDVKIQLVLFTWIVYLALVAARFMKAEFRGKKSAQAALISFILVVIFSVGVNSAFHTLHDELRNESTVEP